MLNDLGALLELSYRHTDYPALAAQVRRWQITRPLAGLRILDATPIFGNTVAKYLPLVAAGAKVTLSDRHGIPGDRAVIAELAGLGISVATDAELARGFDVVCDCAGAHAEVPSRFGYTELTKTGAARYADHSAPVVLVDSSRIKLLETAFGTGDGMVRALAQFGHPVTSGLRLLIFGGGKVGAGCAWAAIAAGAAVSVVDPATPPLPAGAVWVAADDAAAVAAAINAADIIVTATGVRHALAPWASDLTASSAVLANMGADDEFGPGVAPERALFGKVPINFALTEPTQLRYLDPTMALVNACAVALAAGEYPAGLSVPEPTAEALIRADVLAGGQIAEAIAALWPQA